MFDAVAVLALAIQVGLVAGAFRCWECAAAERKSGFDPARAFRYIMWLSAIGLACTLAMLMTRGN